MVVVFDSALDAERAFYAAFAPADIEAMMAEPGVLGVTWGRTAPSTSKTWLA